MRSPGTNDNRLRICVVGGGPAGMAAAWAAAKCGAEVTLIERSPYLGGVLPQCIHTGFGTQLYGEDFTGGEYEALWEKIVYESGVSVILNATVLKIVPAEAADQGMDRWEVHYADPSAGAMAIKCDAVILATGCTERTLPQMNIPGSRPAGIFTAGAAQRMMNIKNMLPGRNAVILGSGDIGLIMARRMHLEGINVKLVLGEKESGLARNIVQCIEDFNIPLRYGWTVSETLGYQRLTGVRIREIETGREEIVECDTLLIAAGLVPDRELVPGGELVPEQKQEGLYLCGNADHVHDLVDNVTQNAVRTAIEVCGRDDADIPPEVREIADKQLPAQSKDKSGNMVCTVCPKGCIMKVTKNPFAVTRNECTRGEDFARQEVENPQRIVTTVLRTESGGIVSARTEQPVPKEEIPAVMEAARTIVAPDHAKSGSVISHGTYRFVITGANNMHISSTPRCQR